MKKCCKCDIVKPLSEFNQQKQRKDGLTSWCKICVRNRCKEWYNENSEKVKYKESKTRKSKRKWIHDIKTNNPCRKCGESHHACIDFHHVDPSKKDFTIGNALYKLHYTVELILEELEKCIPLCANCHRIFHHEERAYDITLEEFLSGYDYLKEKTKKSDFDYS